MKDMGNNKQDNNSQQVTIVHADYNPKWHLMFEKEAKKIHAALKNTTVAVEHVGSTSVPGLIAKPIIDILLVVPDSADEPAYAPQLEAAGYRLHRREPDWHEHRVFKGSEITLNLHVFSAGDVEIKRMIGFRDWLRANDEDRELYASTKQELAKRPWRSVQDYADAKTDVVEEIIKRALT